MARASPLPLALLCCGLTSLWGLMFHMMVPGIVSFPSTARKKACLCRVTGTVWKAAASGGSGHRPLLSPVARCVRCSDGPVPELGLRQNKVRSTPCESKAPKTGRGVLQGESCCCLKEGPRMFTGERNPCRLLRPTQSPPLASLLSPPSSSSFPPPPRRYSLQALTAAQLA